jgi:hypothetical protein
MPNEHLSAKDILYDKTYQCPVCDESFTSKAIKVGKNQVLSIDVDLYPRYKMINPLLYDCIMCPHCGYSALTSSFDKLLPTQKQWIKDQLSANYKKYNFLEYATLSQSIIKHKYALLTNIVKKGKLGEQAYIALHIAWLYRDLKDTTNEKIFLEKALTGFMEAFEKERFPICNLDEATVAYIMAALSYLLNNPMQAKQYISLILTNPHASPKIKDRAYDLKEQISTMKQS